MRIICYILCCGCVTVVHGSTLSIGSNSSAYSTVSDGSRQYFLQ